MPEGACEMHITKVGCIGCEVLNTQHLGRGRLRLTSYLSGAVQTDGGEPNKLVVLNATVVKVWPPAVPVGLAGIQSTSLCQTRLAQANLSGSLWGNRSSHVSQLPAKAIMPACAAHSILCRSP